MQAERWVTLDEAARRAGRSYSWARDRAVEGRLEQCPGHSRPILVSVASVAAEIARTGARSTTPRPHLRLVVNNSE